MKRVICIVLDSLGIGALPDAERFGDIGAHTLRHVFETGRLHLPTLTRLGLGHITGCEFLEHCAPPLATVCRMQERSNGKDSTVGHFELGGIVTERPFPTYPNGFPNEIIDEFTKRTGYGVLCNLPYSGTEVLKDYGQQHLESGRVIVYTSADSVFQIAAHEQIVPPEELYRICQMARELLQGEHAVARVIARPFVGTAREGFVRTLNRRDFSLPPPAPTFLDALCDAGIPTFAIGKINDLFAGRGITHPIDAHGNAECMQALSAWEESGKAGFCFANLVDFDAKYGHRNDAIGYAEALCEFDRWLSDLLPRLGEEDLLFITADHGCDPSDESTDHTREYVPLLCYRKGETGGVLSDREGLFDLGASVLCAFGISPAVGKSIIGKGEVR